MPAEPASIAAVAIVAIVTIVAWRAHAFERIGRRVAGAPRRPSAGAGAEAAEQAAHVAQVAELAAELAHPEELRFIRWTPARAVNGARVALGASPAAWYLWLPEPEILVRVPDALVASVERVPQHGAVVRLDCRTREAAEPVTATDGEVLEAWAASERVAARLLDGLVILDPQPGPATSPHTASRADLPTRAPRISAA